MPPGMSITRDSADTIPMRVIPPPRSPPSIGTAGGETVIDPKWPIRRTQEPKNGRRIVTAILNPRARTAKTTTAVNFAAALVRAHRRALVIDLDPQGHATRHLGVRPDLAMTTGDLLSRRDVAADRAIRGIDRDLFLVPSSLSLAKVERDLSSLGTAEMVLRSRLLPLREQFDQIILDCPPSLGALSLNALCAADELIIPVSDEDFGLNGLDHLVDTLTRLRARTGRGARVAGVVITRYDGQRGLALAIRQAASQRGLRVYQTLIRENTRLAEARARGLDIFAHAPRAAGAEDYQNLALEYLA
jgi:chromosome partitioning protein